MAHFDAVLPDACTGRLRAHVDDTETEVRRLLATAAAVRGVLPAILRDDRAVRTASSEQVRQPIFGTPSSSAQLRAVAGPLVSALGRYSPLPGATAELNSVRVLTRMQQTRNRVAVMTRSRRRKLQRLAAALRSRGLALEGVYARRTAGAHAPRRRPVALAQQTERRLEEIVVTAQKREENLQAVPISIQAIGSERLASSRSTTSRLREVLRASRSRASGPASACPISVASRAARTTTTRAVAQRRMYLDEQPITTIQGSLDVHLYDIARVEALRGRRYALRRQLAGRHDPHHHEQADASGFEAGYGVEGNYVEHGEAGTSSRLR